VAIRPVATEFLRLRPWIVAPFLAFAVGTLVVTGAPTRQVVGITVAGGGMLSFFLYERWRGARRMFDARALYRSLLVTALGIGVVCTATGGIASPLLPMGFAPCGVALAAFGRSRASTVILLAFTGGSVVLALAAPALAGLAVAEPARRALLAGSVVCAAVLLRIGVSSLSAAHARTAEALSLASEEMVRTAVARTEEMEELGQRVAHEVKNPLAAVRALVEVMLESADEKGRRRLEVAASEVARIERIVDAYGSATHPLDSLRRAPVPVVGLVRGLVTVLEPRADLDGTELSLELAAPGVAELVVPLDRDRIKEALLNLVLNALEAAPGGKVVVGCRAQAAELILRVTDTGRGMDRETLARVGTPHFTQREGGTGLGVAHARRVAERHGGRLDYESEVGRGTIATLRVPIVAPAASAILDTSE